MQFTVRDFRRCERADLAGEAIIVVAGRNNQGKTSALQAIALTATGEAMPSSHKKKEASEFVRVGAEKAKARAKFDGLDIACEWPKATINKEGEGAYITPMAAMIESLALMDPDEVAAYLGAVMQTQPSLADLQAEFKDALIPSEIGDKVWSMILNDGWDAAFEQAKNSGVRFKGRWEDITGRKWGEKVGADWKPDNWRDELDEATIESLNTLVAQREVALERTIARVAVDMERVKLLRERAGDVESQAEYVEKNKAEVEAAQKRLADAKAERDALGDLPQENPLACPHCGGLVEMRRESQGVYQIAEASTEAMTAKAIKKLRGKIAEADGKVVRLGNELNDWKTRLRDTENVLAARRKSREELDELKGREEGGATEQEVQEPRDRLAAAKADLAMVEQVQSARQTHTAIMRNSALRAILAPEGLRKTVMGRSATKFVDEYIAPVCEAAGWPRVTIEPDMTIKTDGIAFRNQGQSRGWLTRAVLQVAMARAQGDAFIILDGADVLDPGNRNSLFKMLASLKVPAIVGVTTYEPKLIAGMIKMSMVEPYWIADGIMKPLAEVMEGG